MSESDVILYGIPNCDQVRKARAWLDKRAVVYRFHDFKKSGADLALILRWQEAVDWPLLLNRKGSTWRQLPEARRLEVQDAATAAALMSEFPSLIKRPVISIPGRIMAGFSESDYQSVFEH